MDDLDPASREEAANEEYRTFGGKDVDFEVKVHGNDGNVSVYNGPGEKFDQVSETEGIADGTTVHIFSMFREKTEQTGGNRHRWCDTGMAES